MLKVFEAFAGIGTQRMALRNLGIEHEVVAIAEIDKFAIKSYEVIHGKTHNVGDISQVQADDIPNHDLFTYSFPCQDISIAGKQGGLGKDSGTRSSLLWECNRVIESKKPKYLMLENVKNLVGKKFKPSFDEWLEHLESLGYTNYWKILNAKDYGVPQNRERVFVISILGEHEPYVFPEKLELTSRLKDVLEDKVDEKFYLSKEKAEKLIINSDTSAIGYIPRTNGTQHQSNTVYKTDAESPSMQATDYKNPVKVLIKNATVSYNRKDGVQKEIDVAHTLNSSDYRGLNRNQSQNAVVEPSFVIGSTQKHAAVTDGSYSPTLTSAMGQGGGHVPMIDEPKIAASRGRENGQQLEVNKQGTSNSLTTVQKDNYVVEQFRIRKLTPKECWRLMGCSDEDFHKAEEVNSNTQLYKQAGNAIVVDVLEGLFGQLFR